MKSFKASVTLDEKDLLLLNQKYNRWSMGPSEPLRIASYFILIYAVYTLFMVYLQIKLFSMGTFAYLGLFTFRLISGLMAVFLFLGKFNPIILKAAVRIKPDHYFAQRTFVFKNEKFEVTCLGKETVFVYGEIIKCDIAEKLVTFQTKHQNFLIRESHLTQGTWPEFICFLKGKKDKFNHDPKLFRKEALKDL